MAQHIAIIIVLGGLEQHHVEAANALRILHSLALIVDSGGMNGKQRHEPGSLSEKRCILHIKNNLANISATKLANYTLFQTTSLGFLKTSFPWLSPHT